MSLGGDPGGATAPKDASALKDGQKALRLVVLTAAITALVTVVVKDWLPILARSGFDWITRQTVLIVEVQRAGSPVSNVSITVSDALLDEREAGGVLATGGTSNFGLARLQLRTGSSPVYVYASVREGTIERMYGKLHPVPQWPHSVSLDVDKDFRIQKASASVVPVSAVPPVSPDPSVSPDPPVPLPNAQNTVAYGAPLLAQPRSVRAVLEIDWVKGTPRPPLEASLQNGKVSVAEVLKEVGIELEVVWDEELPESVLGDDGSLDTSELLQVMRNHRGAYGQDLWHFYFILGPKSDFPALSVMFDSSSRMGAALFNEEGGLENPQTAVRSFLHEIGHLLNLPHPYQAYGDTRSVMSSPYRWQADWSWDDPTTYRFDNFGAQHIGRAPLRYVKPGESSFLDYGAPFPASWTLSQF